MLQSTFFTILSLVGLTACLPAGVFVSDKGEVGASFGGYSASAGLGGGNGGLHAEAGTPGGPYAAAGLGGKVADGVYTAAPSLIGGSSSSSSGSSSTASIGSSHPKPGGTVFDDIFNIPQSVLRSVNDLLNNKRGEPKGTAPAASAGYLPAASNTVESHVRPGSLYDDIFNIPQSALRSVNQLLNKNANSKVVEKEGLVTRNSVNPSASQNGSTLYNDIFNIPQSVLSAVTRLLNRF